MKALLQRVKSASVEVGGRRVGEIEQGLLVFLGVEQGDSEEEARWLAKKTLMMRVFADADKPMNVNVIDAGGGVLVVSQFTLAADVSRGNRPSFAGAAEPGLARSLYETFIRCVETELPGVQKGKFGADMQVQLVNDGPVTFLLERSPS